MTTLLTFVNSGPVIRIPKALALRAAVPVLAVTLAACGMLMFGGEPAAPAPGTGVQAERPMVARRRGTRNAAGQPPVPALCASPPSPRRYRIRYRSVGRSSRLHNAGLCPVDATRPMG
jgi:hypothetical protein